MVVAELLASLGIVTDEKSVAKANAAIGAVTEGLMGLQAVAQSFIGALGLAGLVTGFVSAVRATADYGDQTKLLAQRTGVAADELQKLAYAAGLSNVSSEELAVGLQHLAKTGVKDVYGETLRLAEQFAAMPDGAEKTKIAMEKFGRGGARLIPVLNAGKEGLAGLAQEAVDLGLVLDKDTLDAADDFNDELDRLKGLLAGIRNRLTVGFLKPVKEIAIVLRESVMGFMKANTGLMEFLTNADAVNYVLTTLALLLGVVAAIGVVLAAPFIAMVAAVLLAGAVLQDFLYYLTGDGESLIGRFIKYYKEEFGSLGKFTSALVAFMEDTLDNFFKNYGKKITEFLAPITNVFRPIVDKLANVGGGASEKTKFYDSHGFEIDGNTGQRTNFVQAQPGVVTTYTPTKPDNYPWLLGTAPEININVTPSPGMNEKDLAIHTKDVLWKEWGTLMQQADAGMVK